MRPPPSIPPAHPFACAGRLQRRGVAEGIAFFAGGLACGLQTAWLAGWLMLAGPAAAATPAAGTAAAAAPAAAAPAAITRAAAAPLAADAGPSATAGAAGAADTPATARAIELQFRGGERQQALLRLAQALAARPTDASLRFLQGVLLSESGRPTEAVPVFERMTEDFPDLPEPYNNLAVLQAAAGQLDRARALLETALRLDPSYRTAHENLGDVFVRLAQRAYEAAAASPQAEPALKTKLRLARDLVAAR